MCIKPVKSGKNHAMENEREILNSIRNLSKQSDAVDDVAPFVSLLFDHVANRGEREVVIVCFGTTAISGDALGPMVGSLLTQKYDIPAFVYGTEESNLNGKNMSQWLDFIKTVHKDALFVAVDASLGKQDKIGQIVVRDDGVCPSGVTGKSARFGDVGVLGVVAANRGDALMQLMCVSPVEVSKLADKISILLNCAICKNRYSA